MNPDRREPWWRCAGLANLAAIASVAALPAHAALGETEASVQADQQQLGGTMRVLRSAAYTVHELQAPSGTLVREYVSPTGTVFGVAWQGPSMPDLRLVLGTYFDRYVEAAAKRVVRGPVLVEQPGLVVQSGGHMRGFVGRAYIPEAVPQGVAADAVR